MEQLQETKNVIQIKFYNEMAVQYYNTAANHSINKQGYCQYSVNRTEEIRKELKIING